MITGRVERHRQGARDEGRRGRRDRGAGRALGGQARRRSRARSRRRAGRPRCTRPTCPTSRTCDRLVAEVLAEHGRVDVLVNNAGRSIRRSIANSYDRFHDFQRTMQLNYFGALKLIMGFLPGMRKRKSGHIINISSIGAQTNTPRFSAYVASKSALDAFSRSIASEIVDDKVFITTVYMPLVRTPMIAPTGIYDAFPTASPDEAADMIVQAMIYEAEEGRDAARDVRRGAVRAGAEVGRRDPEPGVQAVPGELRGKGREEEGRGGLHGGRRVRAPDAGSALVVGRSQSAVRRRSHWGWGYEDEQPSLERARRPRREGIRDHLGFGDGEVEEPVPLEHGRAAARRGSSRRPRWPRSARPTRTTAPRTRTARRTATSCGPFAAASTTCRTWSPSRATRARSRRCSIGAASAGRPSIPYGGGTSVVGGVEARGRRRLRGRGDDRPRPARPRARGGPRPRARR